MPGNAPLKNIIKGIISGLEKKEKEERGLTKIWGKAAGKKVSRHTKPVFMKGRRLMVYVGDSSRLYKLTLEKGKLLEKINASLEKRKKIREIQFRIGKITQ